MIFVEEWAKLVSQTAFPILVAIFLLRWVTEKLNGKLQDMVEALRVLKEQVEELSSAILELIELLRRGDR